ncbi:DNA-binding protein REB1 [Psilocybe cubensis]|uniref:DNA-binding protein REB1 n=2 Tax=Psilocybe cubensis TaxID=181762 RepID=A0ACB8H3S4_PSICU|nr:DNA-binding protein REB1 [Psilocybe cubensis]KAH9482558.1 DNA-binding protein REB1 [Psilocybe cubensis]
MDAFGIDPSAINAESSLHREKKKKKKNKRPHEDDSHIEDQEFLPHPQEKQKKRKHAHAEIDAALTPEQSSAVASPDNLSAEPEASAKPKKKKKDKGKSKATSLSEQTDAEIEANSQASAAALLSAIVAASVTNPEPMQPPVPPPYHPQMVPSPGQQFMPYPPMQPPFGYPQQPPPPGFDPNGQLSSLFPVPVGTGGGAAFSELTFGSNEDLLRALQDLDMSKIASVLKNLGETSASNNNQNPTPLSYVPNHLMQLPPAASGQYAPPSDPMLGQGPPPLSHLAHKRTINMSLPGNEQHTNPEHAFILANKWLNPNKLAELVRDEGLVYKKGKFSAIEEQQLKIAIHKYAHEKQLTLQELNDKIFLKHGNSKDDAFWSEITAAVPLRPIIAVYHHVRRAYHPLKQQGTWSTVEDEALKQAVADLGQQWEKISDRVGRMASDCRDRYRNHIHGREIRITGHWSKEEEDKLIQIVTDMTIKQGRDLDNDVFWGRVSELMGGTRGRQQCRIKWTDALSKRVKNEGQKPRWGQQDAFILVHKIDSLNVRDDTEIDWKVIPDPDWNLWSAHTLQRRWLTMKKEIMDILRVKKAHLPAPPPPSTRKRKERKVTSAPAVNEPDTNLPDAGSSTGPGTVEGSKDSSSKDANAHESVSSSSSSGDSD